MVTTNACFVLKIAFLSSENSVQVKPAQLGLLSSYFPEFRKVYVMFFFHFLNYFFIVNRNLHNHIMRHCNYDGHRYN